MLAIRNVYQKLRLEAKMDAVFVIFRIDYSRIWM